MRGGEMKMREGERRHRQWWWIPRGTYLFEDERNQRILGCTTLRADVRLGSDELPATRDGAASELEAGT